ncbi:hypothetical protein ISS07_01265 [Candidatus Woesearchaeota archaeon]|nr:hypothetical protein [Candidatus Woesearchaeota archaeon]
MESLTDIVETEKGKKKDADYLDKYIFELIRASEKYFFYVKLIEKDKKEKSVSNELSIVEEKSFFDVFLDEETEEGEKELIVVEDDISYKVETPKRTDSGYKVEKPKQQTQELWEKEGFYQTKTTQSHVSVQIWPEHSFYDHFKRRKAFLFC